ncbi:hypothetical protein K8I31_21590 [bacterium]|nr:hypothetical protein [bacterium]
MKKILAPFIFLLLCTTSYSQTVSFDFIDRHIILPSSRYQFIDLHIQNQNYYFLTTSYMFHSNIWSLMLYQFQIGDLPQTAAEYYTAFYDIDVIFSIAHESDSIHYKIPDEERLQNRIIQIDDIIYLPDRDNHSHQFTPSGEYLGRFDEFDQFEESLMPLKINDASASFPVQLSGEKYNSYICLKDFVILLNDYHYAIVNIDEFNQNGNSAQIKSYPRRIDQLGENNLIQHTFIHEFSDNYFIIQDDEEAHFHLYTVDQNLTIHEIQIDEPPKESAIYYDWKLIENGVYYQLEILNDDFLALVRYNIQGLTPLSSAGKTWQMYE